METDLDGHPLASRTKAPGVGAMWKAPESARSREARGTGGSSDGAGRGQRLSVKRVTRTLRSRGVCCARPRLLPWS